MKNRVSLFPVSLELLNYHSVSQEGETSALDLNEEMLVLYGFCRILFSFVSEREFARDLRMLAL